MGEPLCAELGALLEHIQKQLRAHPDAQQVIGVKTTKGNLAFAVSLHVMQGDYREEDKLFHFLEETDDTRILYFITMWNNGGVDMCSHHFRTRLLAIDPENLNAVTLLQGPGVYHAKPLKNLLPPEKTERKERK